MYRHYKLTRLVCSGHSAPRAMILGLTFVTVICMFVAFPMVFIGQSRHRAWENSGLEDVAFFTADFRFGWPGFDSVPPAYERLKEKLSNMEGCTAVSVDYAQARFEDHGPTAVLCIYPEILLQRIQTPLSEGVFAAESIEGCLPIVLDSRLKGEYALHEKVPLQCQWERDGRRTCAALSCVVTGFLNADNDHISTLGGSNAQALQYFAAKAIDQDAYIVLVSDAGFPSKPYTGDCTSMLLLPPAGASADLYIDGWRKEIAPWNLGQIDRYGDIYISDVWGMAVLSNIDFYMMTAWLMALTAVSLIGFTLMQTDTLRQRLAMFGLIGMTKGRMLACVAAGCYGPFWVVNMLGLWAGNAIALALYLDYGAVMAKVTWAALAVSGLPHILALFIDCLRILKMDVRKQWDAGR